MIQFSVISLLSAIISICALIIVFSIFKKVIQEQYRKPWLFIGISTIILATAQLIEFANSFLGMYIVNIGITQATIYILEFISISVLTYALFLELLILKYFRGKFIKMKFIPVQEGTLGGDIDLNVSNGKSYIALNKDKNYITTEFSQATKKGFEGFFLTENNPKEIRTKYNLPKTPIAWISHIDSNLDSSYLKESLDKNSDIIDPLQLNNIINYIDNFLEQAQNPFIIIELNTIFRTNNYTIVLEFLKYISSRVQRYNGILLCTLNSEVLKPDQIRELNEFLQDLE